MSSFTLNRTACTILWVVFSFSFPIFNIDNIRIPNGLAVMAVETMEVEPNGIMVDMTNGVEDYEDEEYFLQDDNQDDDEDEDENGTVNENEDEDEDEDEDDYDDEDEDDYDDENLESEDECSNEDEECAQSAEDAECELEANDHEWMLEYCPRSCGFCINIDGCKDEDGNDVDMGVKQIANGEENTDTLRVISISHAYMCEDIMADPDMESIRAGCVNEHEMCAFWASIGQCETNPNYMKTGCALACRTCKYKTTIAKCPIDLTQNVLKPGDLNTMFERIVNMTDGISDYIQNKPNILSRPYRPPNEEGEPDYKIGPWVLTFDSFLSEQECDSLIEYGHHRGFEKSETEGKILPDGVEESVIPSEEDDEEEEDDGGRNSLTAWCDDDCYKDPYAIKAIDRIVNVTGIPYQNQEYLQLLKYEVGQYYNEHHDYINSDNNYRCGPRILTFFLYLNDVDGGGGTGFPNSSLNLTVTPKKGMGLLWPSVLDENPIAMDHRTRHEALPVTKGTKYGANAWIHLRDNKGPMDDDCD